MKEKLQEMKNITIKILEPEIERIISKHKINLNNLEIKHEKEHKNLNNEFRTLHNQTFQTHGKVDKENAISIVTFQSF